MRKLLVLTSAIVCVNAGFAAEKNVVNTEFLVDSINNRGIGISSKACEE